MNSAQWNLVALCLLAGLLTACSASDSGSFSDRTIEEKVADLPDALSPEESAIVALGESEAKAALSDSPVNQETP